MESIYEVSFAPAAILNHFENRAKLSLGKGCGSRRLRQPTCHEKTPAPPASKKN